MKNAIILTILLILVAITSVISQTTYTVKGNATTADIKMPSQCFDCIVNIADGATLTFSQDHFFKNTSFTGGNIILDGKSMTLWSPGSFTNTNVTVKNAAKVVSSGALTITNTKFTFLDNTTGTFWATVDMTSATMTFLGASSMEATSIFNLKGSSALIAGDGTSSSTAFIKFNGGTLNVFDKSYVTMMNSNNYYFNWSAYNNGKSTIKTIDNKLNCGSKGLNACSSPMLYGPSSLTIIGVGSNATLPVKLSTFDVKATGNTVTLSWTTEFEQKSSRFEIERSADGINWSKVATVNAKGNSTVKSDYNHSDVLKIASAMSYRLKIVDQDESFAYSPIKSVRSQMVISEMKVYPNPATEYVVISSKNGTNLFNVQLINQNGQVVKQTNGNGNIRMSVNGVQTGTYAVRVIDTTGSTQTFKLMIQ
jgi:Secretion system C-terminal sorting domain